MNCVQRVGTGEFLSGVNVLDSHKVANLMSSMGRLKRLAIRIFGVVIESPEWGSYVTVFKIRIQYVANA